MLNILQNERRLTNFRTHLSFIVVTSTYSSNIWKTSTSLGFPEYSDTRYLSFIVGFYSTLSDFILHCQYFLLAPMPALTFTLKLLVSKINVRK